MRKITEELTKEANIGGLVFMILGFIFLFIFGMAGIVLMSFGLGMIIGGEISSKAN